METNELIEQIKNLTKLQDISDIFLYGSRAFNVFNKNSDFDFIVISEKAINGRQYNNGKLNITTYQREHFQKNLTENKPFAIECYFLPDKFKFLSKSKFIFKLKDDFEKEFIIKIEEDKIKLNKYKNDYLKSLKLKFFIYKLEKQLEWLKKGEIYLYDFKDEYEEIKKEHF